MTTPLTSISGLISGIDTSSLIDAIIAQDRQPAANMETQETAIAAQQAALAAYGTLLGALDDAAGAMQDGTSFSATTANATILAGSKALVSATTTSDAVPGTYQIQVTQLAAAEKLGSTTQASSTAALGLTGAFTVNGQSVNVTATDTLASVRDKINALDSGATPTGVTASILAVSPTDNRLVLTSDNTGAAGATLADTSGNITQTLGFIDGTGAKLDSAKLVKGADANFSIDTIGFTRSSNTVTDAIDGVTLNLTGAEAGATTQVTVSRDETTAATAVQGFVDAYNAVIAFVQQQGTVTQSTDANGAPTSSIPPLYSDSLVRGIRGQLPDAMLQTVLGAAGDLATAGAAGITLGADGKLSFDSTKFASLFQTRYADLQTLFGETRTADNSAVTFLSSGQSVGSGTWDVNITAPATAAALSTSGFSGTYDAGSTPDTMTLTDKQTGKSVQVALTTGMTTSDIVTALQSAITSAGLTINVTTSGNDIALTQQNAASYAGFTVAVDGVGDGASEAWGATASAVGTDVQGTIGGFAATGSGSTLVGNSDTAAAGLTIRYSGTATGDLGNITLDLGTASSVKRLLDNYVDQGSGLLDQHASALTDQNSRLVQQVADIDTRLAGERAALVAQYSAMEAAIANLKSQAQSLLAFTSPSSTSSSSSSSGSTLLGG
ncbi:MAG TPA: flagellar filament capping protein FliD [Gemmatimonadales bacterium]|jgi:flagellar hook-associated protein 2